MPTPDEMRSTVERYVRFMCESNIEGIVDLYAEAATAEDPVGGVVQSGQEALRAFYSGTAPTLQVELAGPICVAGREVAFPLLAEAKLGEQTFYMDVIDVMLFDEAGKISSMRAFWDPLAMRASR